MKDRASFGIELQDRTIAELFGLYRAILRELRAGGIIRTDNAPTGDYAEYLTLAVYGGELAPPSEKSWDVRSGDGRRLQVKARVLNGGAGEHQLGVLRSFDFDALVAVQFDAEYGIARALEVPPSTARALARPRPHENGAALFIDRRLLHDPSVVDVSDRFRSVISA